MLPSRRIAVTFVAVFLIGTVVGALVMWDWSDVELTKFMARTNDPNAVMIKRITDRYINVYHFTPDEMQKVEPLVEQMAQSVSQVRHQFGVEMLGTFDSYHQKISAQLTPEHRAVFDQATQDRNKQLSALLLDKNSSTPPSP